MKRNKIQKKKPYEEGAEIFKSHHLFSCLEKSFNFKEIKNLSINLNNESVGFLSIYSNSNASFWINTSLRLRKEEWFFIFSVAGIILSLDLYKKLRIKTVNNEFESNNVLMEKAVFIFALNYVYEVLDIKFIPDSWLAYLTIKDKFSLKSDEIIYENLNNDDELKKIAFKLNFLSNNELSIFFKKEIITSIGSPVLEFSEVFSRRLILRAKETIALRSNITISKDEENKKNLLSYKARSWFINHYPLLSAVTAQFEVIEDISVCRSLNIQIAAVSAINKTIFINPLANLSLEGMKFVIAHEILHIALNHASRLNGRDPLIWNLACDFVINNWLIEMNIGVPPNGIYVESVLSGLSADEIYLMILNNNKLHKDMGTLKSLNAGSGKLNKNDCDIIDYDDRYFSTFEDACKEHLLRGMFLHESIGRGTLPASLEEEIKAINQPAIPWQVKLAKWITESFPIEDKVKTYTRLSRRQSSTPDIIRPRYIKPIEEKNNYTLGIILDTSGSMDVQLLGKCLGAIASYCSAQEVSYVRLIYCDAMPYDEGFVSVDILSQRIKVKGRGGTVIQQAVNYLENAKDFPKDAPILILSDGGFEKTLTIKRKHAFLVPNKYRLPFIAKGEVFEFK